MTSVKENKARFAKVLSELPPEKVVQVDADQWCPKQCSREDKAIGACTCDHMAWMRLHDPSGHAVTNPEPKSEYHGNYRPVERRDYVNDPLENPHPPSYYRLHKDA